MKTKDIAIIIPVLDDARSLRDLLHELRSWELQPTEIIVAAGADDTEVADLSREYRCRYILSEACRGKQLDDAARVASADTLWFVHADAVPAQTSLTEIHAARAHAADAGYFRFEFTGPRTWQKALIERLVKLRTRLGGMPYGDQGLWVNRRIYIECGGFAHEPLFEEVRLIKRLRSRGHVLALSTPIGVAPRRWEREGWWYRSAMNRLLALGHALGISPARLAARYNTMPQLRQDRHA
jgi:rSAM/selenodomain-associated transferase 2